MKNKKVTYLLIALVVAVWGLILYRILGSLKSDDDSDSLFPETNRKETYNDYSVPKDTAKLLLNYRDPFGLAKQKDTVVKQAKSFGSKHGGTHIIIKPAQPAMNWDSIQYVGYIRNPGSKNLIAMIHLDGQELMLREGESAGELKLLKNMRDSIKINYNGKIKFIVIKPAAL